VIILFVSIVKEIIQGKEWR
jgi:hypothetical protein